MQYPTCRHVKAEGAYCGSPALRDRKYCHYHLMERTRRLRRARALRDNVPYRLEIPALDNLYAIRDAITEVVQAVGSGQLDPRAAGKMLYGIQQAASVNRRIEKMEAAAAETQTADNRERVQELPDLEKELGLPPGADLDAETAFVLRKADSEAQLRAPEPMLIPPPGIRPGSPAYRVYREEAYQMLQMEVKSLRHDLRDYHEQKRQQNAKEIAAIKKEMLSAAPVPDRRANSA